jgi:hypothetical protein
MNRPVIWELHILPMFRIVDRDHMLQLSSPKRRIDMFDYDQVVERCKSGVFQSWLRGHMPPVNVGGPWPDEWLALFDRWVEGVDGERKFLRLAPVSGDYTATLNAGAVLLMATGEKPDDADEVWLERISMAESPREYALVREEVGTAKEAGEFTVRERFTPAAGVTTVIVTDAKGRHEVNIE